MTKQKSLKIMFLCLILTVLFQILPVGLNPVYADSQIPDKLEIVSGSVGADATYYTLTLDFKGLNGVNQKQYLCAAGVTYRLPALSDSTKKWATDQNNLEITDVTVTGNMTVSVCNRMWPTIYYVISQGEGGSEAIPSGVQSQWSVQAMEGSTVNIESFDMDLYPGYTFTGWTCTSGNVSSTSGSFVMPTHDVRFQGQFAQNKVVVSVREETIDEEQFHGADPCTIHPQSNFNVLVSTGSVSQLSISLDWNYGRRDASGGWQTSQYIGDENWVKSEIVGWSVKYTDANGNEAEQGLSNDGNPIWNPSPGDVPGATLWTDRTYVAHCKLVPVGSGDITTTPATTTPVATTETPTPATTTPEVTSTVTTTPEPGKYTVTYTVTGGDDTCNYTVSESYAAGETITVRDYPTCGGYYFVGYGFDYEKWWGNINNNGNYGAGESIQMPARNVEFKGEFKATNYYYYVEHYLETAYGQNTYEIVDSYKVGSRYSSWVSAEGEKRSYPNYVFNHSDPSSIGNIDISGHPTVRFYYNLTEDISTPTPEPQKYTVTYKPGDYGTFAEQSTGNLHYGDNTPVFSGNTTGQDGWEFAGWSPVVENTVTGDATYVAQWKQIEYTVTYLPGDHGTFAEQSTGGLHYGDNTPAFSGDKTGESGWTFVGWSPAVADTVTGNATYTALWAPIDYTVTYKPGEHGKFDDQVNKGLHYGDATPAFSGDPEDGVEGYSFNGWSPAVVDKVTGDAVYVAQWTANVHKVTYIYTDEDVPEGAPAVPAEATYAYGAAVPAGTVPTLTGYTFHGWNGEVTIMPDEDVVVKGYWTPNEDTAYTVRHWLQNLNDDEYTHVSDWDEAKTGKTGEQTKAEAKTLTGFTAQAFQQKTIVPDGSTIVDIYYDRNVYTVKYEYSGTVPADATDLPKEAQYRYGANVTVADAATATGYIFSGWDRTGTFEMPDEDVVIKGSWTANTNTKYVVRHHLQKADFSGYYQDDKIAADETLGGTTGAQTAAAAKTIAGFTAQSFKQEAIKADGSTVINIYYDRNKYKVTYVFTGDVKPENADTLLPEGGEYTYGATVTVADKPTAVGYTFIGWDQPDAAFDMPNHDVEIKGSWSIHEHTVTYVYRGTVPEDAPDVPDQKSYKYGDPVDKATPPTFPGYTFSGWTGEVDTMPDEDVTVYGTWTANDHTAYTVEHYFQNLEDDEFTQDKDRDEHKDGTTGTKTAAQALTVAGFTALDFEQEIIKGDGSTVVKIYYVRNTYKVTYEYTGEILPDDATELPLEATYRYGANVTIAPDATAAGYTFSHWSRTEDFTMPAEDVKITGSWSASDGTKYVIKHWLQNLNDDNYSQDTSIAADQEKTGKTGEQTAATAYTLTGFTAREITQETIAADGSTVVNVYYNRDSYTVTYKYDGEKPEDASALPAAVSYRCGAEVTVAGGAAGTGYDFNGWDHTGTFQMPDHDVEIIGTWRAHEHTVTYIYDGTVPTGAPALPATVSYKFGATVPAAELPELTGYTFDGWHGEVTVMPDEDVIVKGKWEPRTDTAYTVLHYLQNVDGNGYYQDQSIAADQHETGKTGEETKAKAYNLDGFTAQSFAQKTIAADGSTVVEIRYNRKTYTVTYEYIGGSPVDATPLPAAAAYRYGETVTVAPDATGTGYTFSGWSREGSFTMPDEDVVITGSWDPNTNTAYTVKHWLQNANGNGYSQDQSIAADQHLTGETGKLTAAEAYNDLDGFTANSFAQEVIAADGSTVVNIYYDRAQYTVTYTYSGNAPENAPALPAAVSYRQGANVTVAADPTAEGYSFSGWDREGTFTMPAEDVVINGSWSINEYTVIYRYEGDVPAGTAAVPAEASYNYGETVPHAVVPELDGYTFHGWTGEVNTMPAHDVVVTGYWTANEHTAYVVRHWLQDVDGNGYSQDQSVAADQHMTGTTGTLTRAMAYNLTGFTAQGVSQKTIAGDGSTVIDIYYDRNTYTVSYQYLGTVPGDATFLPATVSYRYGAEVTVAPDATANGYVFSGWTREGTFTMPDENVIIYGSWIAETAGDATYIVKHWLQNANGNGYTQDQSVAADQIMEGKVGDMTKASAYDLEGFTALAYVQQTIAEDGSTVVNIYYDRSLYTVTYVYTGTVPADATALPATIGYYSGANVTVAPDATAEGYTFSGWSREGSFTMPDENVTIFGSWDINEHTVTYIYTGEVPENAPYVPAEGTYNYGDSIPAAPVPELEGYTFHGWDGEVDTMPDEDVVVTGYWTVNSYTVTYTYVGEVPTGAPTVPEAKNYNYGASVPNAAVPTLPGYTFIGWTGEVETMPAHDVTVTGRWEANKYRVTYVYAGDVPTNAPALPAGGEYAYGESVPSAATPEVVGYTFSGWDGEVSTMPANDVTVVGVWTINRYHVTYVYEGDVPAGAPEVPAGGEYEYGATVPKAPVPSLEGYTFVGWNGEVTTMFANDVVVTGRWEPLRYTVTYVYEGVVPANAPAVPEQAEYAYGDPVPSGAVPRLLGYTFSGWNGEVNVMPNHDVTVVGSWTQAATVPHTVTVRYRYLDGTEASVTVTVQVNVGGTYSIISPEIPGFKPNLEVVSGVMSGQDLVITVLYSEVKPANTTSYEEGEEGEEEEIVIPTVQFLTTYTIDDYKTALGLGGINVNVGEAIE